MNSELVATLEAIAEAHEAAAGALRRRIASLTSPTPLEVVGDGSAVQRARSIHPTLGPRQTQLIDLLEQAGSGGTDTGALSRAMGYQQPNVYLALSKLVGIGLVDKDTTTAPHTYRLRPSVGGWG